MDYADLRRLLAHPAAGLLRSPHAAFALAFFHASFKATGQSAVPEETLRARLQRALEEHGEGGLLTAPESARKYLQDWTDPAHGWLRRLVSGGGLEPVLELSAATEKALAWVESLRGAAFVGAESRLENVFRELAELLLNASANPEERLSALRAECNRRFR